MIITKKRRKGKRKVRKSKKIRKTKNFSNKSFSKKKRKRKSGGVLGKITSKDIKGKRSSGSTPYPTQDLTPAEIELRREEKHLERRREELRKLARKIREAPLAEPERDQPTELFRAGIEADIERSQAIIDEQKLLQAELGNVTSGRLRSLGLGVSPAQRRDAVARADESRDIAHAASDREQQLIKLQRLLLHSRVDTSDLSRLIRKSAEGQHVHKRSIDGHADDKGKFVVTDAPAQCREVIGKFSYLSAAERAEWLAVYRNHLGRDLIKIAPGSPWQVSGPDTYVSTEFCYLCGLPLLETGPTPQCEHVLSVQEAADYGAIFNVGDRGTVKRPSLLKAYAAAADKAAFIRGLRAADAFRLQKLLQEYAWSHAICNGLKSDTIVAKGRLGELLPAEANIRELVVRIFNSAGWRATIWNINTVNTETNVPWTQVFTDPALQELFISSRVAKIVERLTESLNVINRDRLTPAAPSGREALAHDLTDFTRLASRIQGTETIRRIIVSTVIGDTFTGAKLNNSLQLENLIKETTNLQHDFEISEQTLRDLGYQAELAAGLQKILTDIEKKLNIASKRYEAQREREIAKMTSNPELIANFELYLQKIGKFRDFIEEKRRLAPGGSSDAGPP